MRKNLIAVLVSAFIMQITIAQASAHTLWINVYESFAHPPGHVIAAIGWGHTVPLDDLPDSIKLASYELVAPDHSKIALPLPVVKKEKPIESESGLKVMSGDAGLRKFVASENSKAGTFQVALATADNFFSTYLDESGKKKWAPKAMDEITGAKKILAGMKYKSYAKAFFTMSGKWTEPKPLGFDLELIPMTDLSDVHAGDIVSFKVTLMGKPISSSPEKSLEYLTATSNTFGGPDGFYLASMLYNGMAKFRIPTAGQWVVNLYTSYDVDPNNAPPELAGKCTKVMYSGTISFNVKP